MRGSGVAPARDDHLSRLRDAVRGHEAHARWANRGQSFGKGGRNCTRDDRVRDGGKAEGIKKYISEHPVVRTHPETGRKALYINIGHPVRFKDMTEAERRYCSISCLSTRPSRNSPAASIGASARLAFWDDRCALHNPVNDYHGFRRVMHCVTLAGDTPR